VDQDLFFWFVDVKEGTFGFKKRVLRAFLEGFRAKGTLVCIRLQSALASTD
jgi:hypothetical protein